MTCAKKIVVCRLMKGNKVWVGNNDCDEPQQKCPREKGEGDEKCKDICKQEEHAEVIALQKMIADDEDPRGSIAHIYGIDHVCKNCFRALSEAGIKRITIFIEEKV